MKRLRQFHDNAHRAAEGKMEKLMAFVMPLKAFAAMIFSGLIVLYMVSGVAYSLITDEAFEFAVPFAFVMQGLLLAVLISILWGAIISNTIIKKWRYFPRIILFTITVAILLIVSFLTFLAIPTEWSWFWLITNGIVCVAMIKLSIIGELYFKKTGKRYTEMLKNYQSKI
jgi:amino acid transporter